MLPLHLFLVTMSSGEACIFGPTSNPLPPLTFDRVNGKRSVSSSFPLFKLPVELFSHITPYLTSSDLASLALVDRDCNQLARSIQFTDIKLDYSDKALEFLHTLCEHMERPEASNAINSCVRRLTVSTNAVMASSREGTDLEDLIALSQEDRRCRILQAEEAEMMYYHTICRLIQSGLPNLYVLDWNTTCAMTVPMITLLSYSPVKHIRLNRCKIIGDVTSLPEHEWNLESVVVNVPSCNCPIITGNTEKFFYNLLRHSAPTLRVVAWKGIPNMHNSSTSNLPRLSGIRSLVLDGGTNVSALASLVGEHTQVQSLSVDSSASEISSFLRTRGQISTLENFTWINNANATHDDMLTFIENNNQLRSFDSAFSITSSIIDFRLLPTFRDTMKNLTSLHLAWEGGSISPDSINIIGNITSLKDLWLSAGNPYGTRLEWEIDHQLQLDAFKPLHLLETLSFSRDSYHVPNPDPLLHTPPSIPLYFSYRVLPQDNKHSDYLSDAEIVEFQSPDQDSQVARNRMTLLTWERWHIRRMSELGTRYAKILPRLKWSFIGQVEMGIRMSGETRVAEAVHGKREPCLTPVKKRWQNISRL